MATEAQIVANRRNAKLSTGARTPAGRARSSMNALKSGIHAKSEIIPGEDPAQLAQLTTEYYESIQPQGPEEAVLVNQVVRADWQLRRLARAEADVWNMSIRNDREGNLKKGLPEDQDLYVRAVEDNKDAFDRIYRYQAATARILRNSLDTLLRLRKLDLLQPKEQNEPNLVSSCPATEPALSDGTAETNPFPESPVPSTRETEVGQAFPPDNPKPTVTAETNPIPEVRALSLHSPIPHPSRPDPCGSDVPPHV
jgi:hypothetical protein